MPVNKVVTRGFGPARDGVGNRAGPVTRGYGGRFIKQIVELVVRRIHGRSGRKSHEDVNELVVYAKLIEVNDHEPKRKIEGWVKVNVSGEYVRSLVEHITSKVKDVWVSVTRVIRD